MSFKELIKENFRLINNYLTFKDKVLLFFNKNKYDIMYNTYFCFKIFNFIDDENYVSKVEEDYEKYKYFIETEFEYDWSDIFCDALFDVLLRKANYQDLIYTDERVSEKLRPFLNVQKNRHVFQKIPVSMSMKKDIINEIFLLQVKLCKDKSKYYFNNHLQPKCRYFKTTDAQVRQTYEYIINNNITKL